MRALSAPQGVRTETPPSTDATRAECQRGFSAALPAVAMVVAVTVAVPLILGLAAGIASAAPVRCRDESGWHVCYESTATDGLRVSGVTYQGAPVLASGSMPQIDVAYTGFTLLDELGTAMVPAVGDVQVRPVEGGFEISQVYEMAAWPQCGTYRYDQAWRFYHDGRLEPFVTTFGPGVEGPHTYRTYWRLEFNPGAPGGDAFEHWTGRWDRLTQEARLGFQPPLAPDGSKWRVVEGGTGSSMAPAEGDLEPKVWILRKNPAQGEIDLPAQRRADFPDQWVSGESIETQSLVLWYQMSIFKGTNCDRTMRVGAGPMISRVAPPPPTSTPPPPTAKPPTPTVVLPTPGPTVEGGSTVRGQLALQGRDTAEGVIVTLDAVPKAVSDAQGSFEILGVTPGEYDLGAAPKGYLCIERQVVVVSDTPLDVGLASLQGGDINGDGTVNILDLTAIGVEYGNAAPQGSRADINADGSVGLLDLVLVSSNYGLTCPTEW